jgi:signal peptidase I
LARELRIIRTLYWTLWFVVAPLCLALVLVWALTPPSGVEPGGVLGWIESAVREQPVPVVIVAFTLFEMALWAARHELPFAHHALPPLRAGVPENLRGPFERARALLDEADLILSTHEASVVKELSAKERDQLKTDLEGLRVAIDKAPFDENAFFDSFTKADGEVDVRLRAWRKSELREYLESILVAVGVALALRAFVVEAFKIPSGSMIPTLQIGDHIFVNKFIFGPAIPWTRSRIWTRMPPKRADVIVHAFPEHPEQDFIKRVIAIPGDKLEARSGHPWINGWEVPSCPVGVYSYTEADSAIGRHDGDLFVEYLGDEAYLTLYDRATGGFPEYQGPFYAKPGEVWVMGDNRNNSHDSRMWWGGQGGGVPFENIKGRALFVWLSVLDGKIDWTRFGVPVMGRPRLPTEMAALQPALDKCLRDRPPIEKTTPPPPSKTAGQISGPDDEAHPDAGP